MRTQVATTGGPARTGPRWDVLVLGTLFLAAAFGCQPKTRENAAADSTTPSPVDPRFSPEVVERHNRGVAAMGQFEYERAHQIFSALAEADPDWLDLQVDLAIATLNRRQDGDAERAEQLLQAVAQQAPDNLRARYCLGILALDRGDPQAALAEFEYVAQADPQDAYAVYFAGQCLRQLSQVDRALESFEKAIAIDPYLRSACYAAFQSCLQLGDQTRGTEYREQFSRLENNPQARLAEMKYTRMGQKAEVSTIAAERDVEVPRPSGAVFLPAEELAAQIAPTPSWSSDEDLPPNITACDYDQDGRLDIFLTRAARGTEGSDPRNVLLRGTPDGFQWQADHSIASVSAVNAAVWADFDNDGLTDVYLCRQGPNQMWRQSEAGQWQDVTDSSHTSGGDLNTVDAACFDADHDGDLDLFLVNDGPNELLSNNLDGTFRPLAEEQGIEGAGATSRAIIPWDADADRDLDLLVLNVNPPHEVYRNDRLWSYAPAVGFDTLKQAPLEAAIAVDLDADGRSELLTLENGRLSRWQPGTDGQWQQQEIPVEEQTGMELQPPLAVCDLDGDGSCEVVASQRPGWIAIDARTGSVRFRAEDSVSTWRLALVDRDKGPSLIAFSSGTAPRIWRPGPGRFPFVSIDFTGKEDRAEQMRSNRSGLGVQAAARIGTHWSAFHTLRADSGPGQSLQPVSIGTRGASQIDFVQMTWPDGLFQTEVGLSASQAHRIEETQRQVSSCPVLFSWNGEEFLFVTDVLGAGGLGFNLGRGEYSPVRPWENVLLTDEQLRPRDGYLSLRVAEPMEEICYLDSVRLVAYDLPPGWQMTLDERFAAAAPEPTGRPLFFRRKLLPVQAENDRGEDVGEQIRSSDRVASPPGARDPRFIGRTAAHSITLTFAEPLDQSPACLIMDGWIEYPYSQTMFAAWQAGATYEAPTLEAQDREGNWKVIAPQFGYPAGMPRQAALPLDPASLPPGTQRLRLTTNLEIYWDCLAVALLEQPPAVERTAQPLQRAQVAASGFARRETHPQNRPDYDYRRRVDLWDTRHPRGEYTSFGDALPLLRDTDDAVAIFGPGEEIQLDFIAEHSRPKPGWRRYWVVEFNGWCKDMDLYTRDGETVEPLPRTGQTKGSSSAAREQLHQRYNRRYEMGF